MTGGFRHQALFYVDDAGFLDGTLPFIREGLAAEEPILVAVNQAKIARIKRRLEGADDRVRFLDMGAFGRNPARIIPVWRDFVAEHARSPAMRGIGEPVWPGRSEAELGECDRHESLLNLAFADDEGGGEFNLLCPYDARALGPDVLAAARRNHPEIINGNDCEPSPDYLAPADAPDPFAGSLPRPPASADRLRFGAAELSNVRRLTWSRAARRRLRRGAPERPRDRDQRARLEQRRARRRRRLARDLERPRGAGLRGRGQRPHP